MSCCIFGGRMLKAYCIVHGLAIFLISPYIKGFCTGSIISLLLGPIKSMTFIQHFQNEIVRLDGPTGFKQFRWKWWRPREKLTVDTSKTPEQLSLTLPHGNEKV